MFYGCTSLETLDMSYINTTKVTNMSNVFNGCTNLKTLNVDGFDLSSTVQTYGMFKNCSSLEMLDLSTWKVTQRINDMSEMFRDCTNLKTIYATDWYGLVGNAPYDSNMFWGCTSLVGDIEYASNKTGSWYATTNGGYFTEKTAGDGICDNCAFETVFHGIEDNSGCDHEFPDGLPYGCCDKCTTLVACDNYVDEEICTHPDTNGDQSCDFCGQYVPGDS